MVSWGIVSACMMLTRSESTFYVLRFLLGVAEAGFFPGIILYLTYWFPEASRARAMGAFYFGAPLAFVFGSPLSGWLLQLDGVAHWHGWQWMFGVEGGLAVVVGVIAYFYLDDGPREARWLSDKERSLLLRQFDKEESAKPAMSHGLISSLTQPRTLYMGLVYALIQASVYGVVFYLPSKVAELVGQRVGLTVGFIAAIPWCCALVVTYLVCVYADRHRGSAAPAIGCLIVAALGMAASVHFVMPVASLIGLSCAAAGFIAVQPVFWTFPARALRGGAAAGGIGLINSMGALGGFCAPNVKHGLEQIFHSSAAGLYGLAVTTLIAAWMMTRMERLVNDTSAPKHLDSRPYLASRPLGDLHD
jgi:MFS family permease